jgi:hypothetical protein
MFTLVLVNIEQSRSPYQRRQDVLGFAAPSVSRAWVFWDRIEAAKARAPATAIVLGDVMAHELGHLILASPGHSFRGIMRGEIPLRMRATETFTKRERLAILNAFNKNRLRTIGQNDYQFACTRLEALSFIQLGQAGDLHQLKHAPAR